MLLFFGPEDPFDPQMKLNSATGNVIISVVFGCRFDYSDERFQNFLRADTEAVLLAGSAQAQVGAVKSYNHDAGKRF